MSGSSYTTSGLIPTNQYDSRDSSSAFDAVILALLRDTQFGLARKLRCGALLSDIQGFFDDIKNSRLVALVRRLGFTKGLLDLGCLHFWKCTPSGYISMSSLLTTLVCPPLGSLVLPTLSIIYTYPLLYCIQRWDGGSGMPTHVDDGLIFARGATWSVITNKIRNAYADCLD